MIKDELVRLGRAVARTRTEKHLTQFEVAERAEMDRSSISKIEHGLRDPRLDTLLRLADALETTLGELLGSNELAAHHQRNATSVQTRLDKTSDEEGASTMSATPARRDALSLTGGSSAGQTRVGAPPFENIARVRRKKHLSRGDVSRRSGVHVTQVSRIERGLLDPHLSTLLRLADALETTLGDLLG
jgi:transcriptional regulator with XRE-family HTH domain